MTDVAREVLDQMRKDGWIPVSVQFAGLLPGEMPKTIIHYERVDDTGVQRRRLVIE